MKNFALLVSLLLLSLAAFGQTYTNANLNGNYSLQSSQPAYDTWSKTFNCPTNNTITYTAIGSTTANEISFGVATFDGNGSVSVTLTQIGQFNFSASANTMSVTWSSTCQVTKVNTGHIVYDSSTQKSQTGTYTVQSNGTGTITITGSSNSVNFQLAATDSSGISNTVLSYNPAVNGSVSNTGIAVHQ